MNEHLLAADRLFSGYDKQTILHDISISVPQNKISAIWVQTDAENPPTENLCALSETL